MLKTLIPTPVRQSLRALQYRIEAARFRRLPLERKFTEIYQQRTWGTSDEPFYSGFGSDPAIAAPYLALVSQIIKDEHIRSVVDVGCGDFRVGRQLVAAHSEIDYIGCDIVAPMIASHTARFAAPQVRFTCLNAVTDELPLGDLLLIRQVLQHLSNAHIATVLEKARQYRVVLITDGQAPDALPQANEDIQDGPDPRPRGLFLECAPFDRRCTPVLSVPLIDRSGHHAETIRTVRLR